MAAAAPKSYKGTGIIKSTDYKDVKWEGKTKGGQLCTIKLPIALNMGNIDWTFAEKDDVVPEIVFTACYAEDEASNAAEPFEILVNDSAYTGSGDILLGAGVFYIGTDKIGLTRGGGKFTVEREFREINADGDRGPVQDRILIEGSRPSLTMNALTMLSKVADLYPAMEETTPTTTV